MVILAILVRLKELVDPDVPLKSPRTEYLLSDTHLGLQQRVHSTEGSRDIREKTELCGTRAKARGKAAIVPLLAAPLAESADRHHLAHIKPSPCLTNSEAVLAK